jgi:HEAT repeat protein
LRVEFKVDAMRRFVVSALDLITRKKLLIDAIASTPDSTSSSPMDYESNVERITGFESMLVKDTASSLPQFIQRLMGIFTHTSDHMSVEALLAALRSEDSLARFHTADTLARRGGREARVVFETILQTGASHQRASAARHLHHFSWFIAEPLFRRALSDDDDRVQEAAIFALCKMRLPEAYALAAEVLRTGNDAFRSSAVWGMYERPDPAAVPVLAITLQAENPEVRELALEVLGATENPEAIPIVKSLVGDRVFEVQYAAVLSWVELARESCFPELADWIKNTQGWSRRWILRGFFHATNYMGIESGASSDVEVLIQALDIAMHDDLPQSRLAAFLPLAWMRHPDVEKVLLSGFKNETDSDTQAHMLTAAVHLMSSAADELLEMAMQNNDPLVRQTAEILSKR